MDGPSFFECGMPAPRETTKSGSSTSGNIAATSERAAISGSFSRGPETCQLQGYVLAEKNCSTQLVVQKSKRGMRGVKRG